MTQTHLIIAAVSTALGVLITKITEALVKSKLVEVEVVERLHPYIEAAVKPLRAELTATRAELRIALDTLAEVRAQQAADHERIADLERQLDVQRTQTEHERTRADDAESHLSAVLQGLTQNGVVTVHRPDEDTLTFGVKETKEDK